MSSEKSLKNVLLHACCGPCAEWPLEVFLKEGIQTALLYSNPNIHPKYEWNRRKENIEKLADLRGIELIVNDLYEEEKWLAEAWNPDYQSRCHMCYDIRMNQTAREAKKRGFSAFTSTLLVSIYQNHDAIIEAAERASKSVGIPFMYRDFRDGFRIGQKMAVDDGLYRQKYCGCIYSLNESRFKEKIIQSFPGCEDGTKSVF